MGDTWRGARTYESLWGWLRGAGDPWFRGAWFWAVERRQLRIAEAPSPPHFPPLSDTLSCHPLPAGERAAAS